MKNSLQISEKSQNSRNENFASPEKQKLNFPRSAPFHISLSQIFCEWSFIVSGSSFLLLTPPDPFKFDLFDSFRNFKASYTVST